MAADIRVEKVGRCVVLRMERGENRMNPKFIEDMNRALDKAERCKLSSSTTRIMVAERTNYTVYDNHDKRMFRYA